MTTKLETIKRKKECVAPHTRLLPTVCSCDSRHFRLKEKRKTHKTTQKTERRGGDTHTLRIFADCIRFPSMSTTTVKFAVLIAPVRVTHCLTVISGQRYIIRVARPKDSVDFSTPSVSACAGGLGCIDGTQLFRKADNRLGPVRPPWCAPFSIQWELPAEENASAASAAELGKRTIWITVEKIEPATTDVLTVVATARLDLVMLVGDIARGARSSFSGSFSRSDFSVPLTPCADLVSKSTLNLIGKRCLVDLDICIYNARSSIIPSWPAPTPPPAALLTAAAAAARSTRDINNNSSSSPQRQQSQLRDSARRRNSGEASVTRAAAALLAAASATLAADTNSRVASTSSASPSPAAATANSTPGAMMTTTTLTPHLRRRMNETLDQLQQIQQLRDSIEELEREVAALELEHQQQQQQEFTVAGGSLSSALATPATATSFRALNLSPTNPNGADAVDATTVDANRLSLAEREKRRPVVALRVLNATASSAEGLKDVAENLESQIDNFVDDAFSRWSSPSTSLSFSAQHDASSSNASLQEFSRNAPWSLLAQQQQKRNGAGAADSLSSTSFPHARFESAILQSVPTSFNSGPATTTTSSASLSSPQKQPQQLKQLIAVLAAIEAIEHMELQLRKLIETGDPFCLCELPSVDEIVANLIKRAHGEPPSVRE